jgi:hypothetical protein
MDTKEMLRMLLNHAQSNGFEFRRWYQATVLPEWPGGEEALDQLAQEGHYYTLLFSHEFARCFWKTGAPICFLVPSTTYSRVGGDGKVLQITRKPFTRRSVKPNVWKYHLREMAAAEDPVEYLCRFLPRQEQVKASGLPATAPHLGRAGIEAQSPAMRLY